MLEGIGMLVSQTISSPTARPPMMIANCLIISCLFKNSVSGQKNPQENFFSGEINKKELLRIVEVPRSGR